MAKNTGKVREFCQSGKVGTLQKSQKEGGSIQDWNFLCRTVWWTGVWRLQLCPPKIPSSLKFGISIKVYLFFYKGQDE